MCTLMVATTSNARATIVRICTPNLNASPAWTVGDGTTRAVAKALSTRGSCITSECVRSARLAVTDDESTTYLGTVNGLKGYRAKRVKGLKVKRVKKG